MNAVQLRKAHNLCKCETAFHAAYTFLARTITAVSNLRYIFPDMQYIPGGLPVVGNVQSVLAAPVPLLPWYRKTSAICFGCVINCCLLVLLIHGCSSTADMDYGNAHDPSCKEVRHFSGAIVFSIDWHGSAAQSFTFSNVDLMRAGYDWWLEMYEAQNVACCKARSSSTASHPSVGRVPFVGCLPRVMETSLHTARSVAFDKPMFGCVQSTLTCASWVALMYLMATSRDTKNCTSV